MTTTSTLNDEIDNARKGTVFQTEIKRRLFLEGYTVAVPEPDTGDDLWVVDLDFPQGSCEEVDTNSVSTTPALLRCQLKSARWNQKEGSDMRFTVNLTKSFSTRQDPQFYYVIGLYDPDLQFQFHVGCLPSKFIFQLMHMDHIRFSKAGRPVLDFLLSEQKDYPKYTLRLKYPPQEGKQKGEGPRADVGEFFVRPNMREAFKVHLRAPTIVFAPNTGRKRGRKPKRRSENDGANDESS